MSAKKAEADPGFEARMVRLQSVVQKLESAELPLEESLALYREGLELSRACRTQIDNARTEVRLLTDKGLVPFVDAGPATAQGEYNE